MPNWVLQIESATWAAIFSAIATLFAAIATWRGPRSAAKLAEQMRRESEKSNEKRRLKLWIFTTLMQERTAYYSVDAVQAFNLIDVVYNENRKVRDLWADFISAMDQNNAVPDHAKRDTFRKLLSAMSEEVGLTDDLRSDDFNRVYYPIALAEENNLRMLQRQMSLRDLQGKTSPAANTATTLVSIDFPPPPSATSKQ